MSRMTRVGIFALGAMTASFVARPVEAGGGPFRRWSAPVETTSYVANPANANAPSPMLGTFYPTPYTIVAGDRPTGNGYSPLGQYGINNMVMYGPTSIYRSMSAPIQFYSRGYDGRPVEVRATSFSRPFQPQQSPVVYPTPNSYYYAPRTGSPLRTLPTGLNWIDQN